jgi:N-succinyldiaminopimelate aminotransferase
MPKFPELAERVDRLPASVFEKFRPKMKEMGDKIIRLHIGDTYLAPQYPLPIENSFMEKRPDFNRYCNTAGIESFRLALTNKLRKDNQLNVKIRNILVTNGATNGLSASVVSLLNPGEEMLVFTPCWPFFPGMVKMADADVVEVPIYVRLFEDQELNISSFLSEFLTAKTVALYINTPNNPSGKLLNANHLNQIAEFAKDHQLWIISDEAYDDLTFDGNPHICIATLPGIFQQTISIFTFSKSFMFAGLRLGYAVAEEDIIESVNKTMVHQLYSPSTLSQYMMIDPIEKRHTWIPKLCQHYQDLRDLFLEKIKVKVNSPEGTYFLFFPVQEYLNGRGYWEVIEQLLNSGVSVAPGGDFGKDFENFIRICFTGESPERLDESIQRMNKVFQV